MKRPRGVERLLGAAERERRRRAQHRLRADELGGGALADERALRARAHDSWSSTSGRPPSNSDSMKESASGMQRYGEGSCVPVQSNSSW